MNHVQTYDQAGDFLADTRLALESQEAANSLMLGVCARLARHPERSESRPCLKTVRDEQGLVLAVMMTPPHKLVVYGHRGDLVAGARLLVEDLAREGWPVPGVLGPSEITAVVAGQWQALTGQGLRLKGQQRVYELREVLVPVPEHGLLRQATEADADLIAGWWSAFDDQVLAGAEQDETSRRTRRRIEAGDFYLWQDGEPVSVAMKNRPTRTGISLSMVYTPPGLRGRGYATACVGELSRRLLASGWVFCALFADLANPISNHVYQKIGFRPACDYAEYDFCRAP
jgi:predicted GNAT family acetyltransferase